MPSAPPDVWSRLRTTRAAPPGQAGADARRRTYAAAMEQFEELMRAAEQVGAPARPLPLFYALSQAGRAVTAAHADQPWQLRGHGLKLKDDGQPLLTRQVAPEGGPATSFRRVAEATGSAVLSQPVLFGALCASLPELAAVPKLCGSHPRALPVRAIPQSGGAVVTMNREVDAQVINLPADVASCNDPAAALQQHLSHYPTAVGWTAPEPLRIRPAGDPWGAGAVLRWKVAEEVQFPNEPDRQARIREVAPPYRQVDSQWCRPAVALSTVLSPLMTWWAILYALSMVARYEPDTWVARLDVDKSDLAVPLEGLLEDALEAVPHLVLDALRVTPFLLRPVPRYQG